MYFELCIFTIIFLIDCIEQVIRKISEFQPLALVDRKQPLSTCIFIDYSSQVLYKSRTVFFLGIFMKTYNTSSHMTHYDFIVDSI